MLLSNMFLSLLCVWVMEKQMVALLILFSCFMFIGLKVHTTMKPTPRRTEKQNSFKIKINAGSCKLLCVVKDPPTSQGALKMRKYRQRLKDDNSKLQEAKQAEQIRSRRRRQSLTEGEKVRNRELSKIRMRRYREQKKV